MNTVRVLFLETRTVQREGGETYDKGSYHNLSRSSAQHWISRGAAVPAPTEEASVTEPAQEKSTADELTTGGAVDVNAADLPPVVEGKDDSSDGKRDEQLPASQTAPSRGRGSRRSN